MTPDLLDLRPYPPRITTKELAFILGVTEGAVRHWRANRFRPEIDMAPPEAIRDGGRIYYDTAKALPFIARYIKGTTHVPTRP